jgi:signal transduction histidine kinase
MEDPEFREELLFCLENISSQIESSLEGLLSPYSQDYSSLSEFSPAERIREVVRGLGWESTPSLKVVIDARETSPVRGNPKAFDTTLRNLLINAREILEGREFPGEIRVTLRDEGENLSAVVSDNGPGMSREFMETRLFRPFQTTKKKGTGLGLFSCKLLLEQSGGRIGVSSREGEGSEFWITYPRANS